MNKRFAAVALIVLAAFIAGTCAPAVLQAAERTPFLVVDGDGWLTSNADHPGARWTSPNASRPAFGLQLSERNDMPFDRGTAGATFWVRNAGCSSDFDNFGEPCGWRLGLAVTQFRSIVVGGQGMEIDGLNAPPPYVRVVNSNDDGTRLAGLLTNAFVDFSGVDDRTKPSWFSGFDLAHDAYVVRRATPSGASANLLRVDGNGTAIVSGPVASEGIEQTQPDRWATRAHLAAGTFEFRYARAFEAIPVCVASSEGRAAVRVMPGRSSCRVSSSNPRDSAFVDIVVVGNPR